MKVETNDTYGMYPNEWGSMWGNRPARDRDEHRAPFNGGLGHNTDYGVSDLDRRPVETGSRPLSTEIAAMAISKQVQAAV